MGWWDPARASTRARPTGSRFWGAALFTAALVPLSAAVLHHRSWILTGATTVTLLMCAVAATATGAARGAGNVLLAGALVAGLLLVFWTPADVLQVVTAALLLAVAGVAVRGTAPPRR